VSAVPVVGTAFFLHQKVSHMKKRLYRLKPGFGSHRCGDGHIIDQKNPVYETETNLAVMFPQRFEDITGMETYTEHPFGILVTEVFALAHELPECKVFKKGRRYRVVVQGKALDTAKLTSEDEVNAVLKKELKMIRAGEKLDEDDVEEEDEDDTEESETVDDESSEDESSEDESDDEESEEDDDAIVKAPKPKAKKPKAK
jgi:hypothetical protein